MTSRNLNPFIAALLVCAGGTACAATFTVVNTNDSGTGSLRWAINQANVAAGTDTIAFNIAGSGIKTIAPVSALPAISTTLILDGTTQPGYAGSPIIELHGLNAGVDVSGFTISGTGVQISGLSITAFTKHGVFINGGSGGVVVMNCRIGLRALGGTEANAQTGVWIEGVANNTIGPGNVISGNTIDGLRVNLAGATGNVIKGNRIGTDPAGMTAVPNGFNGISITVASNNHIGGNTDTDRNVISGNGRNGIGIASGASGNVIERNFIGLAADGDSELGNMHSGVYILNAADNKVGGDVNGTHNIIAKNGAIGSGHAGVRIEGATSTGNRVQRNVIGANSTGTQWRGNNSHGVWIIGAPGNFIGTGAWGAGGNLISGNHFDGVAITGTGAVGNTVQGNRIGTTMNGNAVLSNGANGISLRNGTRDNLIGTATAGNQISAHSFSGIEIEDAHGNQIVGNGIGVDSTGNAALGNSHGISISGTAGNNLMRGNLVSGNTSAGIRLAGDGSGNVVIGNSIGLALNGDALGNRFGIYCSSPFNRIGGSQAGEGNTISGNSDTGIVIDADNCAVYGNRIGTDGSGTVARGNGGYGIDVSYANGTSIGDVTAGARNIIAANALAGIRLRWAFNDSRAVVGNYIGLGANGTTALGNGGDGVLTEGDFGYVVNNVISANVRDGIRIAGGSHNTIRNNLIGLVADGSATRPNAGDGIRIDGNGATRNAIGGPNADHGNRIHGNAGAGIRIVDGVENPVLRNSVSGNGGLGIDLGSAGVNSIDALDADDGANRLQNRPQLTSAVNEAGGSRLRGTLTSTPGMSFRVEYFSSASCDASGHGEGALFVGTQQVVADGAGNATLDLQLGETLATGQRITATASDIPDGSVRNTSEFSNCVTLSSPPSAPVASTSGAVCNRQTLQLNASTVAGATYAWTGPNGFVSALQNPTIANATAAASGLYSVTATTGAGTSSPGTTTATVNACQINIANPANVTEGTGSHPGAAFTVTLSPASSQALTMNWQTANGSATSPADYSGGSGMLTIAANATSAIITRTIVGDAIDEDNEDFHVDLSAASGGSIVDGRGTVRIDDDDAAPTLGIEEGGCVVLEGDSGNAQCSFVLQLTAPSSRAVSFTTATAGGTATAGVDFGSHGAIARSLPAGQTELIVNVPVFGETLPEDDEEFLLLITGVQNAVPASLSGDGMIFDDDFAGFIFFDGFE